MLQRLLRQSNWAVGVVALVAASAVGVGLVGEASPVLAGGGCFQLPANADASGDMVTMQGFCFLPLVLRVAPGAKVTFVNKDPVAHQVTGVGWGPDSLSNGSAAELAFPKPGMYPYSCSLHYGMVGVVVVGDGKFVGSGTGVSAVNEVKASVAQPAVTSQALVSAVPPRSEADERPVWLYVGLGALAGVALTAAASGVALARR